MSKDNIKMRVVKPEDSTEVVNFLIEYFFRAEPICFCEPEIIPGDREKADIMKCLKDGTGILAIQENEEGEEIIGIIMGLPREPTYVENYFKEAENEDDKKYEQYLNMMGVVNRSANLFNRYGVKQIFYATFTCVKPKARGKKLGTRLIVELMALGKSLGYELMTADCSSYYSAGFCKRLGMDHVNFLAYSDYVDENNKQIFNPGAPHAGVITFAIRL